MTTILVATDFSANARWATDYALELANRLRGHLVLTCVYNPLCTGSPDSITPVDEGQCRRTLVQLSQLRNQLLGATNWPVDISVVARPGPVVSSLVDEAANQCADLLVMSLESDEPPKTRQLGDLATDMISHTSVPMLLVPPGSCYQAMQHLVLGVDLSSPVDALALASVRWFAHLFDAVVDVVCMGHEPDGDLKKAAWGIRDLLSGQPHTFSFLADNDPVTVLDDYLDEHHANLIMLLPKPHSRLRTFLLESVTQKVARLARVPVLAAV